MRCELTRGDNNEQNLFDTVELDRDEMEEVVGVAMDRLRGLTLHEAELKVY